MKFSRVAATSSRLSLATLALATAAPALALSIGDGDKPTADQRMAQDAAKVRERYIVDPKSASDLGCSIKWQAITALPEGGSLKMVWSSPAAVLALNNRNELTLVRPENGERAWTASAADPIDRVLALNVFARANSGKDESIRIGVMTDAVFYALGFDSGGTLARARYRHVPNTTPRQVGNWFVYGTTSGQISYFNCATGSDSRSHIINALEGGSPVVASPALANGVIVAGDHGGAVVALDAGSGDFLWKKKLLGGVAATPAIGKTAAFIASEDQYLYALDLASGRTLWKYFTQTPLTTSPFVAGDFVLQDVPGEGLLALTQTPESQPGGEVRWRRAHVHGAPIGMVDGAVVFWCPVGHMATLVNLKDGATLRTVNMPMVEHLEADSIEAGGFVAWNSDGRIERLSPMAAAAPAAAPAAPAASASTSAAAK